MGECRPDLLSFNGVHGADKGVGARERGRTRNLANMAVQDSAVPMVQQVAGGFHAEGVPALRGKVEIDLHGHGGAVRAMRPAHWVTMGRCI